MSKFIIVSFYTEDNGYKSEVNGLKESLAKFNGLDHYIRPIKSLGDWMANAHYTHTFIREMLDKYPEKAVVWTDADSRLRRHPVLFDSLICDFAAHIHEWSSGRFEMLCGTMYFANNKSNRLFLDDCIAEDKANPRRRGAYNLATVFKRSWEGKLKFEKLPSQYCKIFDLMRFTNNPVFEHYQASRRFRRLGA